MRDDEFEFELSLFRIRVLHLWSMMLFYEILLFRQPVLLNVSLIFAGKLSMYVTKGNNSN